MSDDIPTCPKCEKPMALKTGRKGKFWGCSRWPKCNGSRQCAGAFQLALPKFKPLFPPKHSAELNFADAEVLKAQKSTAGADAPFCPLDPIEAVVAPRDPLLNFVGAKIKR